jgi:hypothetical protein
MAVPLEVWLMIGSDLELKAADVQGFDFEVFLGGPVANPESMRFCGAV